MAKKFRGRIVRVRRRSKRSTRYSVRRSKVRRGGKRMRSIGTNVASIIESYSQPLAQYGMRGDCTAKALADIPFDRAQQVAKAYREFRIKWISVQFNFPFNTFAPGVAVKPRLWFFKDPNDQVPYDYTVDLLQDMGFKPTYAVGQKTYTFRPTVAVAATEGPAIPPDVVDKWYPQRYVKSPWLSTNRNAGRADNRTFAPSEILHNGVKWFIENTSSPPNPYPVQTNIRVCFQFRKPIWYHSMSEAPMLFGAEKQAMAATIGDVQEALDDHELEDGVEEDAIQEVGGGTRAPPPSPEVGSSITPTSSKI